MAMVAVGSGRGQCSHRRLEVDSNEATTARLDFGQETKMANVWFDANDPGRLRAFDDELWQSLEPLRAHYEEGLGPLEGHWTLFSLDHLRLWQLVERYGDPDQPTWLRVTTRKGHASVDIRQTDRDGVDRIIQTVGGIELIGGEPKGTPWPGL
jgi:hypothetical protein